MHVPAASTSPIHAWGGPRNPPGVLEYRDNLLTAKSAIVRTKLWPVFVDDLLHIALIIARALISLHSGRPQTLMASACTLAIISSPHANLFYLSGVVNLMLEPAAVSV